MMAPLYTTIAACVLLGGPSAGSAKIERVTGTSRFVAYGVLNDAATSDGSYLPMAR